MKRPWRHSRSLSAEEQRMWDYVTRNDTLLHGRERQPPKPAHSEPQIAVAPQVAYRHHAAPIVDALEQGEYAGVDGNTAQRLRRGQYPIDASLDLHGYNREKAHHLLQSFIHGHYARGSRCLLVITGKGAVGGGVLRAQLPQWLNEPDLRPLVLAFDTARQHGGSGAFYVLLKRKR